ncbi:MAG: hypothetical protein H0Z35_08185 [Thermoanaerobacteraceae bacterium]|nr:hypothetical protein [Thermoanaerobacteraceae bacterium]
MIFMLLVLLLALGIIVVLVGIPVYYNKLYGELLVAAGITLLGVVIALIQIFNLPVLNLTDVLGMLFYPAVKFMKSLLK